MMFRGFLFLALLALAAMTFSDGIIGPSPQPAGPVAGPMSCEEMSGTEKERCVRELQIATREAQPESSAAVGGSAPR